MDYVVFVQALKKLTIMEIKVYYELERLDTVDDAHTNSISLT